MTPTEEIQRRASEIINHIDDLPPNEKIACITGVLLAIVVSHASAGNGTEVVAAIADALPRQYAEATAMTSYARH